MSFGNEGDEDSKGFVVDMGELKKKFKKVIGDVEFGVVRGIDFKNVCIVINYDMFESVVGYIYCIG